MDRAGLLNAPGEAARVEEVTLEEPGPGEVVVRMLAVGVCHSDLYIKDTGGWGLRFPIALGHEGCGVVEATGPEVEESVTGTRVILAWRTLSGLRARRAPPVLLAAPGEAPHAAGRGRRCRDAGPALRLLRRPRGR